ncbi:acyltransferase [Salinicola sp. CPA57]|uniref:acyltransferase family protein n=1 Tax=Salinicola sp. CPA57 TaxID=1949080 RepID=UPI0013004A64|nr:acyltransferase [Salinicola sp. CPA57]
MGQTVQTRYRWIDLLRGTAVVLVILLHAQYAVSIRYEGLWSWLPLLSEYLAPFRMPVLMFLSGLMLARSLDKGPRRFFIGKLKNIAHPYMIWTAVIFLLYSVRWALLNEPMPEELFPLFLYPYNYLWFLYCLFIYYAAAYVLFKLGSRWAVAMTVVAYLLYYFLTSALMPHWLLVDNAEGYVVPTLGAKIVIYAVFFMLGGMLGENLDGFAGRIASLNPIVVWLLVALCAVGFIMPFQIFSPIYLLISLASLIPLARLAMLSWIQRWTTLLQWCGRQSIVLFVAHIPILLVAITVLAKMMPASDANLVFILLFCLTFLSCCVLARMSLRWAAVRFLFSYNLKPQRQRAQARY